LPCAAREPVERHSATTAQPRAIKLRRRTDIQPPPEKE
jgi:hypothetical protein